VLRKRGSCAQAPGGYDSGPPHAYRNVADADARRIAVYTPAGMEGWFRKVCTPIDDPAGVPPPVTQELIERMLEAGPR
jgi:hypothetical protein